MKEDCKDTTMEDRIMAGVPPGMPKMSPHEWLLLSLNPFSILVRSRLEIGLEGHGYVAALTDRFEMMTDVPHIDDVLLHFFGNFGSSHGVDISCDTLAPVSRQEWPKFRDAVNRDAEVSSGRFYSYGTDTSYDEMMVKGFQCLLDNAEKFEGCSFPARFPVGKGSYCEKRPTHTSFREYYQAVSRFDSHDTHAHATWLVWCKLIDRAAPLCAQKVLHESLEERRHYPFVENYCAVCGPTTSVSRCSRCQLISYCDKDHQRQDWSRHKKCCKKAFAPGCPL
jgi:hypothetical protein